MEKGKSLVEIYERVYEYENQIQKEQRLIEYDSDLNLYIPKASVDNKEIMKVYNHIDLLEEIEKQNQEVKGEENESESPRDEEFLKEVKYLFKLDKCIIFTRKYLKNGKNDISTFSYKNSDNSKRIYVSLGDINKEIGYIYDKKEVIIAKHDTGDVFSTIVLEQQEFEEGSEEEYYYTYYSDVLSDVLSIEKSILKERQEKEAAALRELESRINPVYGKRLKKMICQGKLVKDYQFEGFDFREVDIDDVLFFNCNFNSCDFSDCAMIGTKFVECKFDGNKVEGCTYSNVEFFIKSKRNGCEDI